MVYNILHVDDEKEIIKLLKMYLKVKILITMKPPMVVRR